MRSACLAVVPFVLFLFYASSLGYSSKEKYCPSGWDHLYPTKKCYKVISNVTFQSGNLTCSTYDGSLASIHSLPESFFLTYLGRQKPSESNREDINPKLVYIGLIDIEKSNNWTWTDGSKFDYVEWDFKMSAKQNGNCSAIVTSQLPKNESDIRINLGSWIDVDCDMTLDAICQRHIIV